MARARSNLVPCLLLLAGLIMILSSSLLSFSQPMSKGQISNSRKFSKSPNLHPRGGQPKNPIEDPLDEEEDSDLPLDDLPPYRPPFRVSLTQLGQSTLNDNNLQYIERKITHALENYEDLIMDAAIHVNFDPHHHKPAQVPGSNSKKKKVTQVIQEAEDDSDGVAAMEVQTKGAAGKQLLAPFRVDVRINTKEGGKPIVVGQHAQDGMSSLLEAVHHTYDILKATMGKEKSKMLASVRKNTAMEELGDSHPWEEDYMEDDNAEYEAQLDAEAEKAYAQTDAA